MNSKLFRKAGTIMYKFQTIMIITTLAFLFSCGSFDKRSNSSDSSYVGEVIMTSKKMTHVQYEYGPRLAKGQILFFYRPSTTKSGDAYITKGTYIGEGKVAEANSNFINATGKTVKAGDFVYRQAKAKGNVVLMYTGKLLECSNSKEVHIFGTSKDGLKPGLRLNVYSFKNVSPDGFGEVDIQKVKTGQIEIIKDGGSNFSIAKVISGKIDNSDIIESIPK